MLRAMGKGNQRRRAGRPPRRVGAWSALLVMLILLLGALGAYANSAVCWAWIGPALFACVACLVALATRELGLD